MIYTDKIRMVADSLDELHSFAMQVGISKSYYYGVKKGHPHYDIPKSKLEIILNQSKVLIVSSKIILQIAKQLLK